MGVANFLPSGKHTSKNPIRQSHLTQNHNTRPPSKKMAHFRGANNQTFEKTESSSSQSYSNKQESSSVTRGYQAQGGVMGNFGGVRYAPQPPVQYQQQSQQYQQLPPPQQGPPQGYREASPPPAQLQQQRQPQQPVAIQRAPEPAPVPAKPKNSFKKNNVRIVGVKLFHVADDVEGPISIQFIGEHPDGGKPYHVAKSTYPPPEKPRDAVSAGGQRFHFI